MIKQFFQLRPAKSVPDAIERNSCCGPLSIQVAAAQLIMIMITVAGRAAGGYHVTVQAGMCTPRRARGSARPTRTRRYALPVARAAARPARPFVTPVRGRACPARPARPGRGLPVRDFVEIRPFLDF